MITTDVTDFSWLRLFLAFAITLGLLAGLGFILKYVGTRGLRLPGMPVPTTKRLHIVESLGLDTKRRVVIVRCDEHEHLLLLSAEGDIVVEANLPTKKP
jgi:flagellar protein FliO/FliZ